MAINWMPYDLLDSFSVFNAACLWIEIEPTDDVWKEPPPTVMAMIEAIEENAGGYHCFFPWASSSGKGDSSTPVSRYALIQMAKRIHQRPKFLFPDTRGTADTPPSARAGNKIQSSEQARRMTDAKYSPANDLKGKVREEAEILIRRGKLNHSEIAEWIGKKQSYSSLSTTQIRKIVKKECADQGRNDLIIGHTEYKKPPRPPNMR